MIARFTIDGNERLEQHLAVTCTHVRAGVERIIPAAKLEGLALAGGYGRDIADTVAIQHRTLHEALASWRQWNNVAS